MTDTLALRITRCRAARMRDMPAYDLLMRVPIVMWSSVLALISTAGLAQYLRVADPALSVAVFGVGIAMRSSVIAYLLILAAATVIRKPPIGRARGLEPRVSALTGTFLMTTVVLFPRGELSVPVGIASTLLIAAGDGLAIIVLIQLRRSFSIMPEARELVTSGVYRWVRHPLYLAEIIATIGSVMQFLSVWTTMLVVVQIAFQLRRIANEESVLARIFPAYAGYKEKTARIIPGIF